MGKKLDSIFSSNKLVNGLLILLMSAMLAGNAKL